MQLIIKLKTQNSKSVSNIVKTQKMYIHNHKNTTPGRSHFRQKGKMNGSHGRQLRKSGIDAKHGKDTESPHRSIIMMSSNACGMRLLHRLGQIRTTTERNC